MAIKIMVLIVSCAAMAAGGMSVRAGRRMASFGVARGMVVGREVVPVANTFGREGRWGKGGGYRPKVTYTYVVGGAGYTSDRWGYVTEGLKRSAAQQALEAVPDEVAVYYDPADPTVAYLRRPSRGAGYVLLAAGVIGLFIAVATLTILHS